MAVINVVTTRQSVERAASSIDSAFRDTEDHAADVMPYVLARDSMKSITIDSMKLITIPAGKLKVGDQIIIEVVTSPWLKPKEWYLFHPAEDAVRDVLVGKRQADERRSAEESSPKPVETEGDRLARFFATSAHEGHEQVRAEPERDELGAMFDAAPPAAALHLAHDGELVMREERDGNPRAGAVLDDWYKTCLAVDMRRQDERRLAASLAAIPDDFDLLPDAE